MLNTFTKDFIWGAATSAYQIEGAVKEDGRGPCVWDKKNHDEKGNPTGDTGDIACGHYHKYKEDVALMKELGLKAYRFSVSWSRIFPDGKGRINLKGVDFYNSLIDELIKNNIEPIITTWHGDLPLVFEENGGWRNRELINDYVNYAGFLFNTFGDRVKKWITHNEPWCTAFLDVDDFSEYLTIAHNLFVAHAKAVKVYRLSKYGDGKIGITLNLGSQYPATSSPEDKDAARISDGFINRWFLHPVLKGSYPEDMLEVYRKKNHYPQIYEGDMDLLKKNIGDFIGINYYSRSVVKKVYNDSVLEIDNVEINDAIHTEMGWEVYPRGLYDMLMKIKEEYNNPHILITENGAAFKDERIVDGIVADDDRVDYLKSHLKEANNAIKEGVNLDGYFAWSLMDNFEWDLGYSKRFGIIRVDYETLERMWKKSALWYKKVIKNNGF